jgi:hypothetical protein
MTAYHGFRKNESPKRLFSPQVLTVGVHADVMPHDVGVDADAPQVAGRGVVYVKSSA